LRERLAAVKEVNAQVWAVDPHEVHAARYLLKNTGDVGQELGYPLLMDPTFTVSAMYGVAFQMRIHTEWSNRPATFVIDPQGLIRMAHRGQRFNDRPSVDRILETLRDLTSP